MSSMSAIILYGRAQFYRKPDFNTLTAQLRAAFPDHEIALAYEDMTGPALPDVIDDLARKGVSRAVILPCGLPADLSLTRWLPGALKAHLEARLAPVDLVPTGLEITLEIARPIEEFVDFQAAALRSLAHSDRIAVDQAQPSMGKPGWTDVPDHNLQVFFCMGARCAHRGAHALFQHLRRTMRDERALAVGPRRVMCARSSCLFPCNQGPLMVVHPDAIWYGGLTPAVLDRIVQEHFLKGHPVEEAIVHKHLVAVTND